MTKKIGITIISVLTVATVFLCVLAGCTIAGKNDIYSDNDLDFSVSENNGIAVSLVAAGGTNSIDKKLKATVQGSGVTDKTVSYSLAWSEDSTGYTDKTISDYLTVQDDGLVGDSHEFTLKCIKAFPNGKIVMTLMSNEGGKTAVCNLIYKGYANEIKASYKGSDYKNGTTGEITEKVGSISVNLSASNVLGTTTHDFYVKESYVEGTIKYHRDIIPTSVDTGKGIESIDVDVNLRQDDTLSSSHLSYQNYAYHADNINSGKKIFDASVADATLSVQLKRTVEGYNIYPSKFPGVKYTYVSVVVQPKAVVVVADRQSGLEVTLKFTIQSGATSVNLSTQSIEF